MMMTEILSQGFAELGLELTPAAQARFIQYYEFLTEKNQVMNLTAIHGGEDTARLHFLDCVQLLKLADFSGSSVIDVGTGAGFPGMPLKIACPALRLTLLDSLNKRVSFLTELCEKLKLEDVRCVHARAEEAAVQEREQYDFAVSRAVARLNMLCELCMPFVAVGGKFIAMKGPEAQEELQEAQKAISLLGGRLQRVETYSVPGTELHHCAVIIEKIAPTPEKYPRRFAKIQKTPL